MREAVTNSHNFCHCIEVISAKCPYHQSKFPLHFRDFIPDSELPFPLLKGGQLLAFFENNTGFEDNGLILSMVPYFLLDADLDFELYQ